MMTFKPIASIPDSGYKPLAKPGNHFIDEGAMPSDDQAPPRPLRGLVLAKYGKLAASTRQRFVQAEPYLAQAGITLVIRPLLDDAYLAGFFTQGKRSLARMALGYARRVGDLARSRDYDFIWVQYELFPYLPGWFERVLACTKTPVLYDFDDAIFHQYDQHPNRLLRSILRHKIASVLRQSRVAFCGNAYLQAYAARYCPRSEPIPTVLNTAYYQPAATRAERLPVIGWIGSPTTWAYGKAAATPVRALVEAGLASMLVVGAGKAADTALPFTFQAWEEARELADLQAMDIGIMPLPDEPWARGKCGYKLLQYMACGLPVVASPVGVNRDIVQHGVNGFLAETSQEWHTALAALVADPALRARMGAAGRTKVEHEYSIARYGPHLAARILSLVGEPALKHEDVP